MNELLTEIKERLVKSDMTAKQLAREAGISYPATLQALKGETKPTPQTVYKLAKALGITDERIMEAYKNE